MRLFRLVSFLALLSPVFAQDNAKPRALPKVHFTFDHPELAVAHYELEIDANGAAHYESRIKGQEKGTTGEGIMRDFTLSSDTRDRLFELIKAANNLDGAFD